jgi:hypothetical protein
MNTLSPDGRELKLALVLAILVGSGVLIFMPDYGRELPVCSRPER